jgi:hypothetical protein
MDRNYNASSSADKDGPLSMRCSFSGNAVGRMGVWCCGISDFQPFSLKFSGICKKTKNENREKNLSKAL